ncbi:PTS fructose transporter subunit IIB [Lactobacillus nasalidis]|uniref:PTS fructose transporter subunit IIB n=1 Tax=Lactobacillus nasalidis TaxID=2797258 RepID=A0ABQ3WAM7_9LACO|nr:PTS fructose transporter subunit IIB [Lactobacillus nasalidis]GHV99707.1 PTS fructose transporter subunit IIB [Lactobacillus nasalidis]GHW02139.1 PTS fructose transporter subunit IIB [Lactobacillus nasalidis]
MINVVGISACPAGLAHTPMAAKAIEKAGKELGWNVKMEQQGMMGPVNAITQEEADAAEFVLIASDQKITSMERFEGKPVIRVDINTCIKAPKAVLEKCHAAVLKKEGK